MQKDDRLILDRESQWCFRGSEAPLADVHVALGRISERLEPGLLLVNFGNAVGLLDLPHVGRVEVVSTRWDRTHFDWMLQDLMSVASALPFAADAPTALPYNRSAAAQKDVLYHTFVYLRHVLSASAPHAEQLLPAMRFILRDPHRRFERHKSPVSIELATRIDVHGLIGAVSGAAPFIPVDADAQSRIPLAVALRGHLPERLDQSDARSTYDTVENRFVKHFLRVALDTLEGMRRAIRTRGDSAFVHAVLTDCDWMERALLPIHRHSLWQEVGRMAQLPTGSTALQRRTGYREVFTHFNRLRLACRVPLSEENIWKLLEVKDISKLYELWTFFSVARTVEKLLGPPVAAEGPHFQQFQISVPWELHLRWRNGTRLFYNPRFAHSVGALRSSYSVPLQPDIGLQLPDQTFHLLDAKFRVDTLDAIFPTNGIEPNDESEPERRGTFTRGDLYKMHTYRDAIPGARSVWIIYPGTEMRFFCVDGGSVSISTELSSSPMKGVGAVPLLPQGDPHEAAHAVLHRLLAG
ncbi:MAG: DUF2357 domain-containing protein [Actinomycetota bacterium]